MNAEILAVGHELLMGEIVDTNSSYIAQQLSGTGITVQWMSHIGDNIDHLSNAFKRGLERSDVVISPADSARHLTTSLARPSPMPSVKP